MASGLRVFRSVTEAIREGFMVYDRTESGFIVRRRIGDRWEMAIVDVMLAPSRLPERTVE